MKLLPYRKQIVSIVQRQQNKLCLRKQNNSITFSKTGWMLSYLFIQVFQNMAPRELVCIYTKSFSVSRLKIMWDMN